MTEPQTCPCCGTGLFAWNGGWCADPVCREHRDLTRQAEALARTRTAERLAMIPPRMEPKPRQPTMDEFFGSV